MFSSLLDSVHLSPSEVVLVRHQDNRATIGGRPYDLWLKGNGSFDLYQSHQSLKERLGPLARPYWASFVGTPESETLFVGLFRAQRQGPLMQDTPMPHRDTIDKAGSVDVYSLERLTALQDCAGKLIVDWGRGFLAWRQLAEKHDKSVLELRRNYREPEFPGFMSFVRHLSELESMPLGWIEALRSSKGIYVLTCPRTREQYVGSAMGTNGFLGRWMEYASNLHGGNVGLKSRKPSDYIVSILETAGSSLSEEEILKREAIWKDKLQSQAIGLNKN